MSFDWSVISNNKDIIYAGLMMTLSLAGISALISLAFGTIVALAQHSGPSAIRTLISAYVELMRNTPLLITLYMVYFGLPYVGVMIPTFTSVVVALVMQHSAFVSEVIRGGLLSVPRAQIEAGKALGMRPLMVYRVVVLPQALGTSLPPLIGVLVILLQDTSLGAAISATDLTMAAKVISQRTATSFEPFIAIAVTYLAMAWIISQAGRLIESRLKVVK